MYAQLFRGLSDPSRFAILQTLQSGERRVTDVVAMTGLSQPNASMHLTCLWDCGLVAREKRGREVYYRLIGGVEDLLVAAHAVLAEAGQTLGACPRYGSGKPKAA